MGGGSYLKPAVPCFLLTAAARFCSGWPLQSPSCGAPGLQASLPCACCVASLPTCSPHLAQICVSEGVKSGCSGAEVTSPLTFVLSCSKTVAGKLLEIPESLVCSSVVLFSLGYRVEEIDFYPS